MKDEKLDQILDGIREERIDDSVVSEAADRVWKRIAPTSATRGADRLENCGGFQSLFDDFRAKRLSDARYLLVQDHIRTCVACRRAFGASPVVVSMARASTASKRPILQWAIAATLVVGIGIGATGLFTGVYPTGRSRAVVETVDGSLYRVGGEGGAVLLTAGRELTQSDEVRTAKGSHAIVRLSDGSVVEMSERADLSVSRGWGGTTIHLERGKIIVQAAKQGSGHLYVATNDCLVSVKGTIFAVNSGTKGSRVSVVQGEVKVDQGEKSNTLHPGDQVTTSASVTSVPVKDEVAWSQNAGQYLALLGEFATLGKRLEAIPSTGLRYKSDLARYLPANTIVYAAIPNLGVTLSQANAVFQQRMQESAILRDWWAKQQSTSGPKLDDLINRIRTFSDYLGYEIVLGVAADSQGNYGHPVVLAQVTKPGLRDFITAQLQQSGAPALTIVDNPANIPAGNGAVIYLRNNLMALTVDNAAQLRTIAAAADNSGGTNFTTAPFYAQVAQSYQSGAGWIFAVDMEQILAHSVSQKEQLKALPPGLNDVKVLLFERKDVAGKTENRAALTFSEQRTGFASWLAAPGPMGALDFVSPDASFAASFVIKNPRSLLDELFTYLESVNPGFKQMLSDTESQAGVSILADVAGPLGGEFTFAIDGPLLPMPSWKVVMEVYSPERLVWTAETLVDRFNLKATADSGKMFLDKTQVGSQTFFTLRNDKYTQMQINFTFVDSYLIAAPSQALLTRAIQNRQTGYMLTRSDAFRSQLPSDGNLNFSALLYHNLGIAVAPLAQQLKATGMLTPAQQQAIAGLTSDSAPGLIYAYGGADRIIVASTGTFLGLNLSTFIGISQGHGFVLPPAMGGLLESMRGRHTSTQ